MPLVVVGSIAYDSVKTPHGSVERAVGGSAVYFSLAARHFSGVRLVGVVGDDFAEEDRACLRVENIDSEGVVTVEGGKTFRWSGEYLEDMNQRVTLSVELNVLEDFEPVLPDTYRDSRFVFLANAAPATQASVLDQVDAAQFVMADTMDLWIQTAHAELLALLTRIDGLMVNDSEALLLTDTRHILEAGRAILDLGPRLVVVKKGEHGAILFTPDEIVPLPAFPVESVTDPTGAGDSFAGAFMGHVAQCGDATPRTLRQALAHGAVAASFTVEDFGPRSLLDLDRATMDVRFEHYRRLLQF